MISVHGSKLRVAKPGHSSQVAVGPTDAVFTCDFFEVVADVDFTGGAHETGAGYRLGYTQLQWIETNRATYSGLAKTDGWSEVKRDRPPARLAQACRDVMLSNDPFSYPAGSKPLNGYTPHHFLNVDLAGVSGFPKSVQVSHADSPSDRYPLQRLNVRTGKSNFLDWVQMEFHFCTVLMVKRQDGSYHQLKHFYWNVHWNANFVATAAFGGIGATVRFVPSAHKNVMNFGPFIEGAVSDVRFAALVSAPSVTTCNVVANAEVTNQIVTEGLRVR